MLNKQDLIKELNDLNAQEVAYKSYDITRQGGFYTLEFFETECGRYLIPISGTNGYEIQAHFEEEAEILEQMGGR